MVTKTHTSIKPVYHWPLGDFDNMGLTRLAVCKAIASVGLLHWFITMVEVD